MSQDQPPTTKPHTKAYCLAMRDMWRRIARDPHQTEYVRSDCLKVAKQWEDAARDAAE